MVFEIFYFIVVTTMRAHPIESTVSIEAAAQSKSIENTTSKLLDPGYQFRENHFKDTDHPRKSRKFGRRPSAAERVGDRK